MDEYIQYINTIKNLEHATSNLGSSSNRDYHYHHHSQKNYSNSNNNYRKKPERREFKDLDDPESTNVNQSSGGRTLISYDDL
jgi:hypothetical protein